jgi:hypothetical protein
LREKAIAEAKDDYRVAVQQDVDLREVRCLNGGYIGGGWVVVVVFPGDTPRHAARKYCGSWRHVVALDPSGKVRSAR